MSRLAAIGGILLVVVAALLGASTAVAGPAPRLPEEPLPPSAFRLEGTNGYSITVATIRGELTGGPGQIAVIATRGDESVTYTATARVTEDSVHADLGDLGRVDLRLHRSGVTEPLDIKCLRREESVETGVYEGVFEFDGEHGYTRARATSLPALSPLAIVDRKELCGGGSSGESRGPNLPGARLAGVSYAGGRTLKFQVNKNRPGGKAVFSASLAERRDRVRIYRQTEGIEPAGSFSYASDVRKARLAPPAPFSGTAQITRDPDAVSPSIAGDLRLAFPGRRVKLTGPAIHVSLNHARLDKGETGSISVGI